MNTKTKGKDRSMRMLALLLAVVTVLALLPVPGAHAIQENEYHDPAENWHITGNRTNTLDVNAVVTHETYYCMICDKPTSFLTWRVPEYTRDGRSAMTRNVVYSDGTSFDGQTVGAILDGTPGIDAWYTGCHWVKSVCNTCGTPNSNSDLYCIGKNIYTLHDCSAEFTAELPEKTEYEYADDSHHTKTTSGGSYCVYCFGTLKTKSSLTERHSLKEEILPQPANGRFAVVKSCTLCDYSSYKYIAAKTVVADYYGEVDGKSHTITVSDLSESGVTTAIRYGNSAESCTKTSAPAYTEEGQYTVYYEITYAYKDKTMTENGAAKVWLRDETERACPCGCGKPDCGCQDESCGGSCHKPCGEHSFVLLDSIPASCLTLGYDRYLCTECGKVEKRDYTNALGHSWQSVVIREADCETKGKTLNICSRCGEVKTIETPKGEHNYKIYSVAATCTGEGFTVKECSICGDRHITDLVPALAHEYRAQTIAAACESGGRTIHRCSGCGSSFVTDYTEPLGHAWDKGTTVTGATCDGEGVTEYRCTRCGYHRLDGDEAKGHVPSGPATCTEAQSCVKCGVVLKAPTGHKESEWITDREPTFDSEGSRHRECLNCGEVLETEDVEKLYSTATTDTHGQALVGGYLVIVTDTDTTNPVANAAVALNGDGSISVRLPSGRLLDFDEQTTVTVLLAKDKSPVEVMPVAVTDRNGNYSGGKTDKAGQLTVPTVSGMTNGEGKTTAGGTDTEGNRYTLTVKVEDYETGRPIKGARVSIGTSGRITVTLPDGTDMDKSSRITVTVTDNRKKPIEGMDVTVKGDLGQRESGKTDKDGKLTVPPVVVAEKHGAYIAGYPDSSFGPELGMTRAEASVIFARLLAERKGESLPAVYYTGFADVPNDAWYSGYVRYLMNYGIVCGVSETRFMPDRAITRAELTAMAVRFFNVYRDGSAELMDKYAGFTDVDSGYWAAEYIRDAAIHGWVEGYAGGSFRPDAGITRAEAVTLINRLLGRTADRDYISLNPRKLRSFTDLTNSHWAYYDVMEASISHTTVIKDGESWSR